MDRLVAEGKAADEGARSWAAWTHKVASRVGWKWQGEGGGGEEEVEAVKMGLGHRLKVDNWGALMLVSFSRPFRFPLFVFRLG